MLSTAVPTLYRETGGLAREVVGFCCDYSNANDGVPWSLDRDGSPSSTMIQMYHISSLKLHSYRVRKFLSRQIEQADQAKPDTDEKRAFRDSCALVASLFTNDVIRTPPEAWMTSGLFVQRGTVYRPACPTVRIAVLNLATSSSHFARIIETVVCIPSPLLPLFDHVFVFLQLTIGGLEWAALEMLVQKPFFPNGGKIDLPKLLMDGKDTGHTIPMHFTRVVHFDKEHIDRYLQRRELDYTLGKGDLVVCYPNFPAIDLFGCTVDGRAFFIQVSVSPYKDKRSHRKDLRALFDERKELGNRSVYDYFRAAIHDITILPPFKPSAHTDTLPDSAVYLFVSSAADQGVSPKTAGHAILIDRAHLKVFDPTLAPRFAS